MARNPIQKGMSVKELNEKYSTEEHCEAALLAWPDDFVRPHCCGKEYDRRVAPALLVSWLPPADLAQGRDDLFAHASAADDVLPGDEFIIQSKNSISTLELSRQA